MKEYKLSVYISACAILFAAMSVVFLQEKCILRELLLVLLDGGFASMLISIFSYFLEERKAIYNFYIASDRYTEELKCFSQFLAEAYIYTTKTHDMDKRESMITIVINRLDTIFDKLYQEFLIIQKETREFEACSIKLRKQWDIQYYMRMLYNNARDVLHCIKMCEELKYRNELNPNRLVLEDIYKLLNDTFISEKRNKNKNKNKYEFTLIKCKTPNEVLTTFVTHGYILLRNGGSVERNEDYEVVYDGTYKNPKFSYGLIPKEISVRMMDRGLRSVELESDEWDWIKKI